MQREEGEKLVLDIPGPGKASWDRIYVKSVNKSIFFLTTVIEQR